MLQKPISSIIISTIVALVIFIGLYFWKFSGGLSNNSNDWSAFGSYLGAISTTIVVFLNFYFLQRQQKLQKLDSYLGLNWDSLRTLLSKTKKINYHIAQIVPENYSQLIQHGREQIVNQSESKKKKTPFDWLSRISGRKKHNFQVPVHLDFYLWPSIEVQYTQEIQDVEHDLIAFIESSFQPNFHIHENLGTKVRYLLRLLKEHFNLNFQTQYQLEELGFEFKEENKDWNILRQILITNMEIEQAINKLINASN